MNRILVIRGGAIGDFVLTLPAIKLLRDNFPQTHLEILGYRHIAALAEKRFYAEAVRSIEYGALSSFFTRGGDLSQGLADYFQSFDLVISYLFDPDGIFEENLRRSGVENFLAASPKITGHEHAATQLARPLEAIDLRLTNPSAELFPSPEDREFARDFLSSNDSGIIALHPGSGSKSKNWPVARWIELLRAIPSLLIVGGEADRDEIAFLRDALPASTRFADDLTLPQLAAVLMHCDLFLGHDSGISHIAAAVKIQCILLFGPTDPAIWAPIGEHVRVVRAPNETMSALSVETVRYELMRIGMST